MSKQSTQGEKMKEAKVYGVLSQACWLQGFPRTLSRGETCIVMQVSEDLDSRGVFPHQTGARQRSYLRKMQLFYLCSTSIPALLILPYSPYSMDPSPSTQQTGKFRGLGFSGTVKEFQCSALRKISS